VTLLTRNQTAPANPARTGVPDLKIAAWATRLGPPHTETRRSSLTVTAGEAAVLTLPGGGDVALTVVWAVPAGADELVPLNDQCNGGVGRSNPAAGTPRSASTTPHHVSVKGDPTLSAEDQSGVLLGAEPCGTTDRGGARHTRRQRR